MKKRMKPNLFKFTSLLITSTIFCLLTLTGCSTGTPKTKSMLPDSGPTTKEVYDSHIGGRSPQATQENNINKPWSHISGEKVFQANSEVSSVVANQVNAIKKDFSKVPNPEIIGYVTPHLSVNQHPVPGYFTLFTLYESDHYALNDDDSAPTQIYLQ